LTNQGLAARRFFSSLLSVYVCKFCLLFLASTDGCRLATAQMNSLD
jgi:hypothetical protein